MKYRVMLRDLFEDLASGEVTEPSRHSGFNNRQVALCKGFPTIWMAFESPMGSDSKYVRLLFYKHREDAEKAGFGVEGTIFSLEVHRHHTEQDRIPDVEGREMELECSNIDPLGNEGLLLQVVLDRLQHPVSLQKI